MHSLDLSFCLNHQIYISTIGSINFKKKYIYNNGSVLFDIYKLSVRENWLELIKKRLYFFVNEFVDAIFLPNRLAWIRSKLDKQWLPTKNRSSFDTLSEATNFWFEFLIWI